MSPKGRIRLEDVENKTRVKEDFDRDSPDLQLAMEDRAITLPQLECFVRDCEEMIRKSSLRDPRKFLDEERKISNPRYNESVNFTNLSTRDVVDLFVKNFTNNGSVPFVDVMESRWPELGGPTTTKYFVSHVWASNFLDTVESIRATGGGTVWLDCFACTQGPRLELLDDQELFARPLQAKHTLRHVLCISPSVEPLQRLWILFEVRRGHEAKKPLVLSPSAELDSLTGGTNWSRTECTNETDREYIMNEINKIGTDEMDKVVQGSLCQAMELAITNAEMDNTSPGKLARLRAKYGKLLRGQGKLQESSGQYTAALEGEESVVDRVHLLLVLGLICLQIHRRHPDALEQWKEVRTSGAQEGSVLSLAFSPDGTRLASGAADRTVRLWDTSDPDPQAWRHLRTLQGHEGPVWSAAFAPDGTRLASASSDRTVRLWDTSDPDPQAWRHLRALQGHGGQVNSVAFAPDGTRLASGADDCTVRLWDTSDPDPQKWRHLHTLQGHKGLVLSVAFSPDGARLASASSDGTVRLWDTSDPDPQKSRHLRTLQGHGNWVRSVAFAPDGARLASGSHDGTVRLWDASDPDPQKWRHLRTLQGHGDCVRSVAFAPDGARLASAGCDGTVRLWGPKADDPQQWGELQRLPCGGDALGVTFSPDGLLVAGGVLGRKMWESQAVNWMRQAVDLLCNQGADPLQLARAREHLAHALHATGRHGAARREWEAVLQTRSAPLGTSLHPDLVEAHTSLGYAQRLCSEFDAAADSFAVAVALRRSFDHPDAESKLPELRSAMRSTSKDEEEVNAAWLEREERWLQRALDESPV